MDAPATPAKSSSSSNNNPANLPTLSPGTQEFLKRHNLDQRLLDSDDSDDDNSFDPALLASASRNALANSKIGVDRDGRDGRDTRDGRDGRDSRDPRDTSSTHLKDLTNRPTANLPRRATPPDFRTERTEISDTKVSRRTLYAPLPAHSHL